MALPVEINEATSAWLSVQFKDKAGALAAPSSITYRVDCLTTGQSVKASGAFTPVAPAIEIPLLPEETSIRDAQNRQELKRVTVIGSYGANDQVTAQYDFIVNNLQFIPIA